MSPTQQTVGTPASIGSVLRANLSTAELYLWLYSKGYLSRYNDPAVDALINQQAGLPADDYGPARVSILRQIAVLAQQDPPAIFLVGQGSLYGTVGSGLTWKPNVQGYIPVVNVSYTP